MQRRRLILGSGLITAALVAAQMGVEAMASKTSTGPRHSNGAPGPMEPGFIGPDVMVSDIFDPHNYQAPGDYRSYAFGAESCNVGDAELSWRNDGGDTRHPVIAQNMYRLSGNRLIQIGQSWLKHGFCAIDGDDCGTCQGNMDCDWLGVGCSDPYDGNLNGLQSLLGPKYEVNGFTGTFPYPPSDPPWEGENDRRLRVLRADVDQTFNPGAMFYVEVQYIASDDAVSGNALNNTSYRQLETNTVGRVEGFIGETVQMTTVIESWPTATIVPAIVPGEGQFLVGYKVVSLGKGSSRYEFAIYNRNSDRSAGGFTVPVSDEVEVTAIGFHDVDYHSGEIFDGTDWEGVHESGRVRWATETWDENPDANALRWGTMYNFWFIADADPVPGTATIELFKPFASMSVSLPLDVPEPRCPENCASDDGQVDVNDLLGVIGGWGDSTACDVTGDGQVNVDDLLAVIAAWGPCE